MWGTPGEGLQVAGTSRRTVADVVLEYGTTVHVAQGHRNVAQ